MIVAGIYSFNKGREIIEAQYADALVDVYAVIQEIDSSAHKTKISEEITMPGRVLYNPRSLNSAFKAAFEERGWASHKIFCDYSDQYYTTEYQPPDFSRRRPTREIDFVKDGVGIEVQFGKYAFMVYNVAAKMTIFRNQGIIEVGVEIVPVKEFADEMSTGVSYFEQFVWDLEQRGVADIDVPVLILGIMRDRKHDTSQNTQTPPRP